MFLFKKKNQPFKLFVSVAAGINQLPLIHAARKLGFSIIAVDRNTSAPGFPVSDIRIQESIEDSDEIYQKLCELLIDGKIRAVLSRSYGPAVLTAAKLCEKLDIPFLPVDAVENFTNKKKMKTLFNKNNIPTADFVQYSSRRKKPYDYPMVIKPVNGHAKSGVRLLNDSIDLEKYMKVFSSRFKSFLLEKYVDGDEIIVFGIVQDRTFHLVEITDKLTTPPPYFSDIVHSAPSKYADRHEEITGIAQKICGAFDVICTPLVIEMKIKDASLVVIEAVCEFGGEFIPEFLIPSTQNINIFEQALLAMTGEQIQIQPYKKSRNFTVIQYITGKKGSLKSFSPIDPKAYELISYSIFKEIGAVTSPAISNHDRIGFVAASAKTKEQALQRCNRAIQDLKISYS